MSVHQGHRPAAPARASGSTRNLQDAQRMRDDDYRPTPRPSAPATRRGIQDARTIRDVVDRPPASPAAPAGGESNFRGQGHRLAYFNADEELINTPDVRALMNDIRRDMELGRRTADGRIRDHDIEDRSRSRDTWNRPPQQAQDPPSIYGWSGTESPPRHSPQNRYVAPPRSPEPPRASKRTPSHSSDCTIISDSDPENPPTAAEIEWARRRNAEIRAEVFERIRREGDPDPAGDNGSDCDCSDCRSMDGWRSR
ncbi:uncharacterized protein DNG_04563 [Cephalotrichum gorgonifer]|uniref:Uncharacterized protein n=1 Tax=Cephalotrichum gorgonifer TaxID=2041049 RepID=A0AAE8SUN5_9PEZI|nr:uncharacterized protein DNG_04563 [Cephalotrichum gorgonifer]